MAKRSDLLLNRLNPSWMAMAKGIYRNSSGGSLGTLGPNHPTPERLLL